MPTPDVWPAPKQAKKQRISVWFVVRNVLLFGVVVAAIAYELYVTITAASNGNWMHP